MPSAEAVTLGVHVAAGFVALFGGAGAIGTKKGGLRHRQFGRAFVYGMVVVAVTSLGLLVFDPTGFRQFLALVAVFSFYFVFSGYRVLARKRPDDRPTRTDWTAVVLLGFSGVGLFVMGAQWWFDGRGFATVLVVFGGIASTFSARDVRLFRRSAEPGGWFVEHLMRMAAGYIAAVSAFSAVNFMFLPAVLRWLWPTVVGVPIIVYFQRKYESKFA